jgi:hypothetical protein
MGDRKPIGVAYRDQDIDGGDIGTGFADLALANRKGGGSSLSEAVQLTYTIIHNRAD